jgi:Flp pilus assembly protein TadD
MDGKRGRTPLGLGYFAASALSTWLAVGSASGQVMDRVPSDAVAVFRVDPTIHGSPTTQPSHPTTAVASGAYSDLIAAMIATVGVQPVSVDPRRDVAVYVPNGPTDRDPPPVVLLLPVNDYAAFIAAQPAADTRGAAALYGGVQCDAFYARLPGYVAVSRARASLDGDHAGVKRSDDDRAALARSNVAVYVNGPAAKGVLLSGPPEEWTRPPADATAPAERAVSVVRSTMDREINATDQLLRELGLARSPGDLHEDFGLMAVRQLDYGNALEQLRAATSFRPDQADYHVSMATVWADVGNYTAAADELRQAVRLDPKNDAAFHNAGIILLRLGADEQAIRMLAEAVRLRPNSPASHSDLAVALIRCHRFDAAEKELDAALATDPDFAPAKANLKVVQRMIAKAQRKPSTRGGG